MFTVSDLGNISVLPLIRTKLAQRWDKCFFIAVNPANRSSVGTMIAELRDGPINLGTIRCVSCTVCNSIFLA